MKKEIVVDTSYLIMLLKEKKLDTLVRKYAPYMLDLTLYEYLRGIYYLGRNAKKAKEYLEKIFNIIHLNNEIILKACEIWNNLAKKGSLISELDIIIGAACIVNEIPLVTLDRDFKRLKEYGLEIETPVV